LEKRRCPKIRHHVRRVSRPNPAMEG
jgi:hypothetical protein